MLVRIDSVLGRLRLVMRIGGKCQRLPVSNLELTRPCTTSGAENATVSV